MNDLKEQPNKKKKKGRNKKSQRKKKTDVDHKEEML